MPVFGLKSQEMVFTASFAKQQIFQVTTPVKTLSCLQCEEKGDACVWSEVSGNGI